MMRLLLILTIFAVLNAKPFSEDLHNLVRYVNEESGAHWTAALPADTQSLDVFRSRICALKEPKHLKNSRRPTISYRGSGRVLPQEFDARKQWPDCASIRTIRDQSACGSCWAFGAVEAMSDRICIASKQKINVSISAINLVSCCEECGDGCEGGYLGPSWDYWMAVGIVTGGSMEEGTGCQPYPFPKCMHHAVGPYPKCKDRLYPTPHCKKSCQANYTIPYRDDRNFGSNSYNLFNEKEIMEDILLNGPAEAAFEVYEDFFLYKSGIYHHVSGEFLGGHAIRILGWGVENNVSYWLIANSWNEYWGENGYFRIRRGVDECGIEDDVVAGLPEEQ